MKRLPFSAAALALLCSFTAHKASAQDSFPSRPIKIVVNVSAGGLMDVTTRLLAVHMGKKLNQTIVVENQAGGGGLIAARAVKSSPADGYTLLAGTATMVHQTTMRDGAGYDLLKDFTGVGAMGRTPYMVVVGGSQPDKTIGDLIARAKSQPGTVSYASAGLGTLPHLIAERFSQQAGVKLMHVPYKGIAASSGDIVGGRVDMVFEGHSGSSVRIKTGQVRALAVTSDRRIPALASTPTLSEGALPGFTAYAWMGLVAPAGTPTAVVQALNDALRFAKMQPNVQERYLSDATELMDMTPTQFNVFLAQELRESRALVKALGLKE